MQSLRVDTVALQRCIDWLDMNPGKMPGQLPSDMQVSWEAIRKLHLDLETVRGDRVEKGIVAPAVRVPELDLVEYGISQAAGCSPPAMVGCLLRSHELGTVDLKAVHLTTKAIRDLPMHQWTNTFETLVPQKPPRAHIPARVGETVTAALDVVITQDARVSFRVAVYSRHAKNEKLEDWHFDTPVGSMLFVHLKLEPVAAR